MNFGTPVPLLLGIFLVLSAVALFFLDKLKPGYGRDADKIYAVLFLLSGVFLLGSLTMELIPSFQQMLMVGMLISLMIQNINARTPLAARPPVPGGDGYGGGGYRPSRPSRPVYGGDGRANLRAELDMRGYGPEDPYARPRPMLGGREEPNSLARPPYPQDSYAARPDPYGDGRPMNPAPSRPDPYGDGRSMNPAPSRPDPYGDGRPMHNPAERPDPYGDDRPFNPSTSRSDEPSYPRPADERVRRRRPPKTRSDYNDRYRVDPGNSPPEY
ncbi:MAG: Ycf66 family protein [Nodosilinea sp.]